MGSDGAFFLRGDWRISTFSNDLRHLKPHLSPLFFPLIHARMVLSMRELSVFASLPT